MDSRELQITPFPERHVVIGTAGHVDHGKTTLTAALTGIDPDRLKEEKERGMTIDLGFAYLDLPDGRRVSIIDVPGHERFIRNMLSGATGIDMVLLVVAADEGIMPQTVEHLHIISLLGVKHGVVAITKKDLVDEEWLIMVKEEIRLILKGSPLEDAPLCPVSSLTGDGLNDLIQVISEIAGKVAHERRGAVELPPRLPVDRVFTVKGHGTVVTGTLISGSIHVGDIVEILPSRLKTRVRGIQVHNQRTEVAVAGQRSALNLAGIERTQIRRGDVVAAEGNFSPTSEIDAIIFLLPDAPQIKHGDRLHFHAWTNETIARVKVIGGEAIESGGKGYAQLRLEAPVTLAYGDRFVLRSYSPVSTIRGGRVINPHPPVRRRFDEKELEEMRIEEAGDVRELILLTFLSRRRDEISQPLKFDEIARFTSFPGREIEDALDSLLVERRIVALPLQRAPKGVGDETGVGKEVYRGDALYIPRDRFEGLKEKILLELQNPVPERPLIPGLSIEELRHRLAPMWPADRFTPVIASMLDERSIMEWEVGLIVHTDYERGIPPESLDLLSKVEELYRREGVMAGDDPSDIAAELKVREEDLRDALRFLRHKGVVVEVASGSYFHKEAVAYALEKAMELLKEKGSFRAGEFREKVGTNRRNAILLLEYLDREGITCREGEVRVAGRGGKWSPR